MKTYQQAIKELLVKKCREYNETSEELRTLENSDFKEMILIQWRARDTRQRLEILTEVIHSLSVLLSDNELADILKEAEN